MSAPEQVERICRAAPFADNDAGIPEMVATLSAKLAEAEATLANGSFYQEKDIDALQADRETLYKSGIAEIAARNPNVMEYMNHWEARAETAEAKYNEAAQAALDASNKYAAMADRALAADAERDAALGHIANISSAASQAINEWRDPYEPVAQWEKGVSDAMRGLGEACAAARKKGGEG